MYQILSESTVTVVEDMTKTFWCVFSVHSVYDCFLRFRATDKVISFESLLRVILLANDAFVERIARYYHDVRPSVRLFFWDGRVL